MSFRTPYIWALSALSVLAIFGSFPLVFAQDSQNAAEINRVIEDSKKELMAPCCWKDTLMDHSSPRSDELSGEVRSLAEEGKSKDEILNIFAERYGENILARPRTEGLGLLFYLVPALLLVLTGLWLGVRKIPKLAQPAPATGSMGTTFQGDDEKMNKLFEDELERHRG